jgi:quercetin dioxygenase-like cupin family protein
MKDSKLQPTILRPGQLPRSDRGGNVFTTLLVSSRIGARGFMNGITEFLPGAAVAFHNHNCEESAILLEGEAILDIDGRELRLAPLDTTWIPPNVVHRLRNASPDKPLKIFWTYASPEATRTLASNGETRLVASEHRSTDVTKVP